MSLGVSILYMPGMPSALIWPYEWVIVFAWIILGFIFYKSSMSKYGTEYSNKHMNDEIARVIKYDDQTDLKEKSS